MELILATHNKHKIKEIADAINDPRIKISSLLDHPAVVLPPETGTTFVQNSAVKARSVYDHLASIGASGKAWILADDSGLCVDALNGEPGVYSSRYSGEPVDYKRNNRKLVKALAGVPMEKRGAHFICSMVLISPDGKEFEIEGRMDGSIIEQEKGSEGFGYDPVFYLPEYKATAAEIPLSEKNKISHRGRACKKVLEILVEFL